MGHLRWERGKSYGDWEWGGDSLYRRRTHFHGRLECPKIQSELGELALLTPYKRNLTTKLIKMIPKYTFEFVFAF